MRVEYLQKSNVKAGRWSSHRRNNGSLQNNSLHGNLLSNLLISFVNYVFCLWSRYVLEMIRTHQMQPLCSYRPSPTIWIRLFSAFFAFSGSLLLLIGIFFKNTGLKDYKFDETIVQYDAIVPR